MQYSSARGDVCGVRLAEMYRNLERRSRGAKAGLVAAICVAIFLVGAGGAFLVAQLNGLRHELTNVRREMTGAKDRIARLERKGEEPLIAQSFNELAQKQADARPRAALELSREEAQLVRDYIKVPPAPPGTAATIQIGAVVPPAVLVPLPQQVSEKVPKLFGARFTTDRNGAIVIVRSGSRQADAIVGPN
jgi:hypothetical protein